MPERSVLHVLPHPGGGGQTYVDTLTSAAGYRTTTTYLASGSKGGVASLARAIARVSRLAREHDLVHVHGESAGALLLLLVARRPSIVTLHGLHLLRRFAGYRRRAAVLNLRAIVRAADRTICVSEAERTVLAASVGEDHRILVIHNGVHVPPAVSSAERAEARAELGLTDSEPVGIWVGSLDERRDPLVVVRAAERARVTVLMAGDGSLRDAVERASTTRTRVLGHRRDVPRLLAAADFFVLMSHREGFSFAVLEAMAHGLPAVVADVPENVELIGDSGWSVPYGDEETLVATLRQIDRNAGERRTLGDRARERVEVRFSAEAMITRTQVVYDEVLGD